MNLVISSVIVVLLVVGIGGIVLCSHPVDSAPAVRIERVDTALAWASPCWGYNAPKIVRNAAGEMWAVNFFGKYGGHERTRILKRTTDGIWINGGEFDSLLWSLSGSMAYRGHADHRDVATKSRSGDTYSPR